MKKNISINLQGIIFHIEEDGYEVLSRYLAEVKAHFAHYRGHEDIVADIEGRIAEIFSARLSPTQQVIALEDVEAMTAKMGRVSDFAADDLDAEDVEDTATAGSTYGTATSFGTQGAYGSAGTATAGAATATEPRRLYRDMAHRRIAGVAAGIAQYFAINPVWVRLAWILLVFVLPGMFEVFDNHDHDGHFQFGGWAFLAYIILWIVLPKRYDAPAPNDAMLNQGPLAGRKLFRDTGTAKVAGVAAGLAAYFNIDVTLVRVILLAGLLGGGFTFFLYIILWIVLPEAKTVSDKMRMRGDAVTLEGYDSSLRANEFADGSATTNRPVGAFVEDAARGLRPLVDFVGSAIRIVAGVLLTVGGFSLLLTLAILLGAGIGLIPSSENISLGDAPAHVMLNGIPAWGIIAGFFAFGIPALALFLSGLNLLLRRSLMSRTVGLSMLGLWILSIVGVTMAVAQQSRQYQFDAEVEQLERYPAITTPVIMLDARRVNRDWEQHVDVRLAAADSGRAVEVLRVLGSKGPTEDEARRNALSSIDYSVRTRGDSSLVFDDHFSFLPNAKYRDQELALTIRLPRNRTYRMSSRFAYDMLNDENFVNNKRPENPEQFQYRLRGNKFECIGCSETDLGISAEDEDNDVDINIDIDSDGSSSDGGDVNDDEGDDNGLKLNYGGAPAFDTDLESYGSGRRTFQQNGFNQVQVVGGYRVVVRKGDTFKVEAGGDEDVLEDMRVTSSGNTLEIRPRNTSFFSRNRNENKVLVVIEMPSLEKLDLAGSVQADLGGFDRQDRLSIEQAGASHLRLNGSYGNLKIEQAGACRTTATGSADAVDLDAAGACELAAANLHARTATVDLAGVCKARLHVTESIRGDAVGASQITYSGKPSSSDVDATGPSSVKRL
ncbi:PspC domain-containing protein [Hymenobacter sp. BT683]|uniref:PspC domain-containing protein n=1 Tax=Hymenobacter jeongseonensis TaxID=2791027 RepID=A0ABS0IHW1_9BACT|nr:PspC domain-containing protein [Hymenobacter jeongseonensis]MBF9237762.1 PspC domain-containing protein [Hymenobacter jeongseonensis]